MGVLPLEFKPGVNRKTLALDGSETYDVIGQRQPRTELTLLIHRKDGGTEQVAVTCRLDTAEEVSIYEAGGVLQRFAQDFWRGETEPLPGPSPARGEGDFQLHFIYGMSRRLHRLACQ